MTSIKHEITFKLTPRDLFDFMITRFPFIKYLFFIFGFVFFAAIANFAVVIPFLEFRGSDVSSASLSGAIPGFFIIFVIIASLLYPTIKNPILKENLRFTFYEDRFLIKTQHSSSEILFSAIKKIVESKRIYLFVGKLNDAYIIPKRFLSSEQNEYFRNLKDRFYLKRS